MTPMNPPQGLDTADLEVVYDSLAEAIDRVGPERSELQLTKLVLLLAQAVGDRSAVLAAIETSANDL